jgi:hypothetical protein
VRAGEAGESQHNGTLNVREMIKCRWKIKGLSQKKVMAAVALAYLILVKIQVQAQDGKAGIEAANKAVRGYFEVGTALMYAVGGILGLIGAVKVYQKWNGGDQDTSKVAAAWFGSCIFLVVVATIIKSFFGID